MKKDLKRVIEYGKDKVKQGGKEFLDFQNVFTTHISTSYNLTCESCGKGFSAAWGRLLSAYNQLNNTNMSNSKFQFKKGITVIFCAHLHTCFSNATLTDEAALCLLKQSIDHKMHFETMPADWEKQLAEFVMPPSFAESLKAKEGAASTEAPAAEAKPEATAEITEPTTEPVAEPEPTAEPVVTENPTPEPEVVEPKKNGKKK